MYASEEHALVVALQAKGKQFKQFVAVSGIPCLLLQVLSELYLSAACLVLQTRQIE